MKRILFLSVLVLTVSCAHFPDVRPGANGVHKVVVAGTDKKEVVQSSLKQAKSYCEDKKLSAAFVAEKVEYTGSMDESTHTMLGKATRAVTAMGGIMGASSTSGSQAKDSGVVITSGAAANSIFTDENAYTSTMTFKCI